MGPVTDPHYIQMNTLICIILVTCSLYVLWKSLDLFLTFVRIRSYVKCICKSRDGTHGYEHMRNVMLVSFDLILHDFLRGHLVDFAIVRLVMIVALLHDVDDGKYDTDGTLAENLAQFVEKNFAGGAKLIIDIIHRISYSKELAQRKLGGIDWLEVLGTRGTIVRNYVSDADKLESLGRRGHARSREYNSTCLKQRGITFTDQDVYREVESMMPRFKATINYLWTDHGKKLGEIYIREMIVTQNEWKKELGLQ